jgi:hypothetical protein
MNENDKILINAYLDGETSPHDSKYIESLLESNQDANEYANKIKKANYEINAFFNSDDSKELDKSISNFIEEQKKKNIKSKSNFSFFNFRFVDGVIALVNQRVAAVAMVFAITGLLVIPSFLQEDEEFFNINVEREGYVTKDGIDINQIISDTLIDMADADIKKANLQIGSELILISITNEIDTCISGSFLYDNKDYKFKSCLVDGVYETEFN